MSREDHIYDLGDVDRHEQRAVFSGPVEVASSRPSLPRFGARSTERPEAPGVGPALAGSLSIFVPGLGQMIAGDIAWGLFYLSGMGFCAAASWAVLVTLDRLVPTLSLFDLPTDAIAVALSSLALSAMVLHLSAVLHAHAEAPGVDEKAAPHPLVAGLASLLVPGWGQLLAHHRRRAALFLGGVWLLGAAWSLVTPVGTQLLARVGLHLPAAMRDGWGPVAMLAAPLILWAIAVYDAAAGAASERRA